MKTAVIGGGSWGTTLANVLAKKGVETILWVREQQVLARIKGKRENALYLPGVELSENIKPTMERAQASAGVECFVFAVPSQYMRGVFVDFLPHMPKRPIIVCASKGIEVERLKTMSEVAEEALASARPRFAMLSGPSFAHEVSRETPTAIVLGCQDKKLCKELQRHLSTEYFRVYTNEDVRGVELGGAVKNIIAIAAGISDGLGFGTNARAALITRGLAEMSRLGKAMGGDPHTFMGLAGMGDLVLTCTGDLSRNRQVGLKLGQGMRLMDILGDMNSVAEGVKTTEAVRALGQRHGVELPITEKVHSVLYNEASPEAAVRDLMQRELKDE